MPSYIIDKISPFFSIINHEKQFAFIFSDGELIDHFSLSSTVSNSSGVTDFKLLNNLIKYKNDNYQILIVHNHPKSLPLPSHGDFDNFKLIFYFLNFLKINLFDYMIVSDYGFFSFKKNYIDLPFFENDNNHIADDLKVVCHNFIFDKTIIENCRTYLTDFNYCFCFEKKLYLFNNLSFEQLIFFFERNKNFLILYKKDSELISLFKELLFPIDIVKI